MMSRLLLLAAVISYASGGIVYNVPFDGSVPFVASDWDVFYSYDLAKSPIAGSHLAITASPDATAAAERGVQDTSLRGNIFMEDKSWNNLKSFLCPKTTFQPNNFINGSPNTLKAIKNDIGYVIQFYQYIYTFKEGNLFTFLNIGNFITLNWEAGYFLNAGDSNRKFKTWLTGKSVPIRKENLLGIDMYRWVNWRIEFVISSNPAVGYVRVFRDNINIGEYAGITGDAPTPNQLVFAAHGIQLNPLDNGYCPPQDLTFYIKNLKVDNFSKSALASTISTLVPPLPNLGALPYLPVTTRDPNSYTLPPRLCKNLRDCNSFEICDGNGFCTAPPTIAPNSYLTSPPPVRELGGVTIAGLTIGFAIIATIVGLILYGRNRKLQANDTSDAASDDKSAKKSSVTQSKSRSTSIDNTPRLRTAVDGKAGSASNKRLSAKPTTALA